MDVCVDRDGDEQHRAYRDRNPLRRDELALDALVHRRQNDDVVGGLARLDPFLVFLKDNWHRELYYLGNTLILY